MIKIMIASSKRSASPAEFVLCYKDEATLASVSKEAMESGCNCKGIS